MPQVHPIKSLFLLILLTLAVNSYSADSFEFDPQRHSAKLEAEYIGFVDKSSDEKVGPELFADETDPAFFTLVKKIITDAEAQNTKTILIYENKNSENHGSYNQIIPDF